jgi:branched-subunit amino acid transport protein
MNAWVVILAAGFGSYLLRISMIALADRFEPPARFDESVALVAPAAFAALAVTGVAGAVMSAGPSHAIAPLVAIAVAAIAVGRTASSYAGIAAGLPAFWLVNAILG